MLQEKNIIFTDTAKSELNVIIEAVNEILDMSLDAFINGNLASAANVEPLEQIIDDLKEKLRMHHILRLQQGDCTIEAGFIWSDLLTNLERVSDHCSNIAGCVTDIANSNMNLHESLRLMKTDSDEYKQKYEAYSKKYSIAN